MESDFRKYETVENAAYATSQKVVRSGAGCVAMVLSIASCKEARGNTPLPAQAAVIEPPRR